MAAISGISLADATFNPWIGCTKVSLGDHGACEYCYAERDNERRNWVSGWGQGIPRRRTKTWNDPIKWNRKASETGYYPRVFCASLADVFDNEVDQHWRDDLWMLIETTPNLRWMLLTKRIGNVDQMIPKRWIDAWPVHVGLMATIVTQQEWDRDYWKLEIWQGHAPWIGVSAEPLFGRIDIGDASPDWIITGGESGPKHRPLDMDAVRFLRDQCHQNGIAFHHKQNGGFRGKDNGCLVDGVEHKNFPLALAA
jgi:protein gp37